MRARKQLIVGILSFALLFGMIPSNEVSATKKVSLSTKNLTVTKGKSKILKVKNTKKKVKWKILSGKKCITLKKKGKTGATIKGKKKGTAKVQAIIGKKKLTCKVTVKNVTKQNTPKPAKSTQPEVTSAPTTPPATTTPPTDTQTPSNPTNAPTGSNEQDVAALKALIAEQRGRGATVSEDMGSDEYSWANGRLTGIDWNNKNLSGELDVSDCVNLTSLYCSDNQLSSLNVNGCVELISLYCGSSSWRSELTADGYIPTCTVGGSNLLTSLDVSHNIVLRDLNCAENKLTNLDISHNTALTWLQCFGNEITSLDVSHNTALTELQCFENKLTSLDISHNIALRSLVCHLNQLTSLDVSKNDSLEEWNCDKTVTITGVEELNEQDVTALENWIAEQKMLGADISEDIHFDSYRWNPKGRLVGMSLNERQLKGNISFSAFTELKSLQCMENSLSSLDVSGCVNLTSLYCSDNKLTSLDVSKNVNLTGLDCENNQLTSLDVTKNVNLTDLYCCSNQLTSLDLTNNTELEELECDTTVVVTGYNE